MAISGTPSWIEKSDVVSLFPTLVWKIQLHAKVHEPIDAAALGLLHSLRQGQPELKSGEAWQSGHALHRREELPALCDCVSRAAASVLQFLTIGEPALEMTGCWANLYAPGAAHRAHSQRREGVHVNKTIHRQGRQGRKGKPARDKPRREGGWLPV